MLLKKIDSIEFHVLGPQQIRKISVMEVKSPETYDKDGYPMESGLMDPHLGVINPGLKCKTCGQKMKQCPGHFGHIDLVRPVVHSEFGKKLDVLLQTTCQSCGRIAMKEEKINELRAYIGQRALDLGKKIVAKTKNAKKCPHCGGERSQIFLDKPTNFFLNKERIYPTQIREWLEKIPDSDLMLFGYDTERIRPEWFVLTALQVPPITIRPSITLESGIKSEDDLTHKLVDIIRINLRLRDNIEAGAPQLIIEDLWDLLQYHVTTYFDNNTAGVPPAKHRSGRALRTLVQRLQGKKGRFRYNLTGKRVNFAARSIITPDSHLSINELGVPEYIANTLTVPEHVNEWNLKGIKKLMKEKDVVECYIRSNGLRKKLTDENRKEALEEIEPGFVIERKIQDGDIVLFNRQPSLHRLSMMAHKVKVMPGKTLRMNAITCKPYNADFDGDEMNMHVPQTEEGKVEAKELMLVEKQIISPRYGAPVIILDEDGVSGSYILTMKDTKFSKSEAMFYLQLMGLNNTPKPDLGKEYSGKLLFSQLLPKDLNLEFASNTCKVIKSSGLCKKCEKGKCPFDAYIKIKKGKLETGIIDDAALGEGTGYLIDCLARNYESKIIEKFYTALGKIASTLITRKGLTVGLDEYQTTASVQRVKEKAIKEELEEGEKLVKQYRRGSLEHIPGRTLDESFEIKMIQLGSKTKDNVEKQILKEKVEAIMKPNPKLNTTVMILSGSRGKPSNLTNISGLWGQASVREGRPKKGFKNRLITANEKNDVGTMAGGFIEQNFMEGMKAREYFYHCMGGRQGEVDTGVSTKVSGYLYRRLANSLKDLVADHDRTVRTSDKSIIQFAYGDDGIFPQKTIRGKSIGVEKELQKFKEKTG